MIGHQPNIINRRLCIYIYLFKKKNTLSWSTFWIEFFITTPLTWFSKLSWWEKGKHIHEIYVEIRWHFLIITKQHPKRNDSYSYCHNVQFAWYYYLASINGLVTFICSLKWVINGATWHWQKSHTLFAKKLFKTVGFK